MGLDGPTAGYRRGMTLPNHDMSTIADPGSMDPDAMTDANVGNAGDLDVDHEHLATADPSDEGGLGRGTDVGSTGAPIGPPD